MTAIATNAKIAANYRNNGKQAHIIATNAHIAANILPDAIENLRAVSEYERAMLAHALRTLAEVIDSETPILQEIVGIHEAMTPEEDQ